MKILSSFGAPFRQALALISIPLVLSSTGYALFSQQLSVTANVTNPTYTSSQNLRVSFTKTITPSGGNSNYHIVATIRNNGSNGVTSWQSDFSLPSDYSALSCSNSLCTQSGLTSTARNTSLNGTINPGGTVTYDLYFTSANQNYIFTSIAVSGRPAESYETVTGLSLTVTTGVTTLQNGRYITPYTFRVSNLSGRNLPGWRILIPWDTSTRAVDAMDTTVDYGQTSTQLTILSKQAINNSATFTFNATLSSSSPTYVMTGQTIEGQI